MKHDKILLLEESAPTRRLIRTMLRDLDYVHVEEARDVATAEKLLKGHSFDVILTEWRKPRMEGAAFLERLRADESPVIAMTPVIVVSSAIDLAMLQRAAELGAQSVLTKPFSLRVLKSHLEAVSANRRGATHRAPPRRAPPAAIAAVAATDPDPAPPADADEDGLDIFYV